MKISNNKIFLISILNLIIKIENEILKIFDIIYSLDIIHDNIKIDNILIFENENIT